MNRIALLFASLLAGAVAVAPLIPATEASAAEQQLAAGAPTRSIDEVFRIFAEDWVRGDPEFATRTRYFSGEEQDRLERQLTPRTGAYQRDRVALAKRGLAELQRLDRASMTDAQRLSADVMQWQLQTRVNEEPFLDHSFPLNQFEGANVTLVEALVIARAVTTVRDAENYIAALGQVAARMDEATARSAELAAKGVLPPDFILQATIRQMQGFIAPPPAQNPFVTAFAQKLDAIVSLPSARREELRAEANAIVTGQAYPAWRRAIAVLEGQLPRATSDAGLWRLRDGGAAYAYFLRRFTTTDVTADEIHQLGLRQVASLEREMDGVLRRLGRTEGSVKERIAQLRTDLTYPNPASEESRAKIMRDIEAIMRDAEKRAAGLFSKTPRAPVVAQPYPRFREANAAAGYTRPPADGSRPGIFEFPLRLEMMGSFRLRSLVYHETVPGHHFDAALEVENRELPRFRQVRAFGFIPARGEGWALYAERLAAELGWYENDLEGLLGQLDSELFRARRLVVDTGLHAKRWTRQQAIDYGIEAAEVERYVVNPGQATSYMVGQLKIIELRERARSALGARFSLRDFHDVVLATGTVPLELLERQANAYIARSGPSQ